MAAIDDYGVATRHRVHVHIGLPKTGTTTLEHMFSHHEQVRLFGPKPEQSRDTLDEILTFSLGFNLTDDAANAARIRELVFDDLSESVPVLISRPTFSMGQHSKFAQDRGVNVPIDPEDVARRLRILFPNATVSMMFRNQFDLLESYYVQMRKVGAADARFDRWLDKKLYGSRLESMSNVLDYARLYDAFGHVFGYTHISCAFYEDYREHYDAFFDQLADKLEVARVSEMTCSPALNQRGGVDPDIKHTLGRVLPLPMLKRMAPDAFAKVRAWMPRQQTRHVLPTHAVREVDRLCRGSNRRLARALGRELPGTYPGGSDSSYMCETSADSVTSLQ
jgi:hypothetical protein